MRCPQGVSPPLVSLLLLRGFPPSPAVLSLSPPVSLSPLWSGEHGPGLEGASLVGTGRSCHLACHLQQSHHSPRAAPTPGAAPNTGVVPKRRAGAAAEAPGGARGVTPQCRDPSWAAPAPLRALHRGIRPPFPVPRAVGTPGPARFLAPSVHVASAGRARAARTPPLCSCTPPAPSPHPGVRHEGTALGGWPRGEVHATALPAAARRN